MLQFPFETCVGCGEEAIPRQPWYALLYDDAGGRIEQPVCDGCQKHPAHRLTPIKGHFFEREPGRSRGSSTRINAPSITGS